VLVRTVSKGGRRASAGRLRCARFRIERTIAGRQQRAVVWRARAGVPERTRRRARALL